MEKTDKLHYIKVACSACLMVAASMGLCFYCAGVFYQPVAEGLSISIGQASACTTIMLICMALTTVFVPYLLRKVKLETLLWIGTILAAGSVLCISFCFNQYFMYFFSIPMGIGAAMIGMVPATTMINNWFEKKKSWTTSIVLAASAFSAAIFSPMMSAAVSALGWRMGLVIQAVLILILMGPALYWRCSLHPAAVGHVPYGQEEVSHERQKTPKAILVSFALIAVFSAALIGLPMHFSTLATSMGQNTLAGAVALSWCMIGNFVFKLLGGFLSDKLKPVLSSGILDVIALGATAGILISILTSSAGGLVILAFFFGSVFALNELSLPLLVSNRMHRKYYATVYALLNFVSTLTTALAIMTVGFIYDRTANYIWIYVIAVVEEVIIALLIWYLIHNEKVDDLVTNEKTRSFVAKLRADRIKRANAREEKAARRKEQQAQAANGKTDAKADAKIEPSSNPSSAQDGSDAVFKSQMALIDAQPDFAQDKKGAAPAQSPKMEADITGDLASETTGKTDLATEKTDASSATAAPDAPTTPTAPVSFSSAVKPDVQGDSDSPKADEKPPVKATSVKQPDSFDFTSDQQLDQQAESILPDFDPGTSELED